MKADAMTELILETFRVNGLLIRAGDALVADVGLTSARWQVLGAIALSPAPLSVAGIARNMGLTRQAVQRVANEMARDGLARFDPNPHHQRAKLVVLTPQGRSAYGLAMKRQAPWAKGLSAGLSAQEIKGAAGVLRALRQRLDKQLEGGNNNA